MKKKVRIPDTLDESEEDDEKDDDDGEEDEEGIMDVETDNNTGAADAKEDDMGDTKEDDMTAQKKKKKNPRKRRKKGDPPEPYEPLVVPSVGEGKTGRGKPTPYMSRRALCAKPSSSSRNVDVRCVPVRVSVCL